MGLLEVKHGLLQVAETLDFLHNNARLVHRSISPEVKLFSYLYRGVQFKISVEITSSYLTALVLLPYCK